MSDTILRQINMMELIPRHPSKTFTNEIKGKLDNLGYEASLRTIQRDLQELRLFVMNAAILLVGVGNMMLEGMSLLQWIQFKR